MKEQGQRNLSDVHECVGTHKCKDNESVIGARLLLCVVWERDTRAVHTVCTSAKVLVPVDADPCALPLFLINLNL